MSPAEYGERKHESCRYGTLSPGFRIPFSPILDDGPAQETPILVPLCGWRLPEPHPPAAARVWGGAVEYERDCAVCLAHRVVEVE